MPSQINRTDYELCCECGNPTGRAGKDDDSLYCPACDSGPFCEACYDSHIWHVLPGEVGALKKEIENLRESREFWKGQYQGC